MQTRCRITGGDVAGSELAMLPLNVKSKEWQQRPLLGSQVHVSNQVDDLTTTPEDFLFHPELFACPVLRSLNCKHMKDVSQYLLCSKGILSKTYNFAA